MNDITAAADAAREGARQANGEFGTQPLADVSEQVDLFEHATNSRPAIDAVREKQRAAHKAITSRMAAFDDLVHVSELIEDASERSSFPADATMLVMSRRDSLYYDGYAVTPDGQTHQLGGNSFILGMHTHSAPWSLRPDEEKLNTIEPRFKLSGSDLVIDLDKYRALNWEAEGDFHFSAVAADALSQTNVISAAETTSDVHNFIANELDDDFDNEPMIAMSPEHRNEAVARVIADPNSSRMFNVEGYEAYGDHIRNHLRAVFDENYDVDELQDRHDAGEFQ